MNAGHSGHDTHDHDHGHTHDYRRAGRGRLTVAFGLIAAFAAVEVVGGLATKSLALLSDAGHMITDAVGLGVALTASILASRSKPSPKRTFGLHRLEILGALANAAVLLGVAGYVLVKAVQRLRQPAEIPTGPLLLVAIIGLLVNVVAFLVLREGSHGDLNLQAAYLEVLADLLGSVGVIVAAVLIRATGATWIDPVVAVSLGLFIVPRTARISLKALGILLQAAPGHIDVAALEADLRAIEGVVRVHDLHVWTLASRMEVASAHIRVRTDSDLHRVLDAAQHVLREGYHLDHATLQVEPEAHARCMVEAAW